MALSGQQAYALSRKYTSDTVDGAGAVKGAPCEITSIEPITGGNRITFSWEGSSGTTYTDTLDVMDGETGVSIETVTITAENHVIIGFSNHTSEDVGVINITIDDELDKTSVNPVQNGVIALSIEQLEGSLLTKVTKETGKGLSTNDFTNTDKDKLEDLLTIKSVGAGLTLNATTGELTATGISVPIDNELSKTSVNPVQNKVITLSIDQLMASVAGIEDRIPTDLADLTDDATHRLVTDTEKTSWNAKANSTDIKDATLTIQKNGTNVQTFTANQSTNATANITTDDWVATGTVSSGAVTFSGIDDTGNYGYAPYFNITSSSTNKNPTAQISTLTGTGTSSMSVTYTTDADNGTSVKLRRLK